MRGTDVTDGRSYFWGGGGRRQRCGVYITASKTAPVGLTAASGKKRIPKKRV